MRFGIILNGAQRAGQARDEALAELLAKARTAQQCGFHSLWVGPGYLENGWHAIVLLARAAAEALGLELGFVGLLPLYYPVELADRFIIGSPTECAAEVARYQAVGVEELIMRCQWPDMPLTDALQAIERFGHEVLPRFAP